MTDYEKGYECGQIKKELTELTILEVKDIIEFVNGMIDGAQGDDWKLRILKGSK